MFSINKKKRIVAIIPARGGSKGIPKKNIADLNGKPLIAYTIEAAIHSKYISDVIVSSEDKEILAIAKKLGANILKRPHELADDYSSCESVIFDALRQLKKRDYDIIALLQPTSPLRDTNDIDEAIEIFLNSKATGLISVYEPTHSPLKAFRVKKDGFITGIVGVDTPFKRRQFLPKCYYPNGAIFLIYHKQFLKYKRLLTKKTIPYVMPEKKSIDIDIIEDLQRAIKYLNEKNRINI